MQAKTKGLLLSVIVVGLAVVLAVSLTRDGGDGAPEPGVTTATERAQAAPGAELTATGPEIEPENVADTTTLRSEVASDEAVASARISVTGRLVQAGSGVAGVEVRLTSGRVMDVGGLEVPVMPDRPDGVQPERGVVEKSDGRGGFRFTLDAGQTGWLSLPGDEYVFADAGRDLLPVQSSEVDIDLGDIAVAAGAVLSGVVRDAGGRNLAGVEVALATGAGMGAHAIHALGGRRMDTDPEGRFRFAGLRPADYRLTTASPQHLPTEQTVAVAAGAMVEDVVLTLDWGASIRGQVLDDLGRPVSGATVGAYRKREVDESLTVRGLSHGESVETDANGHFELGGIQEDAVTVRAWGKGYQAVSEPAVAKGTPNLVLRLSRNGSIEGRLVDEQGKGIPGSDVQALPLGQREHFHRLRGSVVTDADGSFVLEDVAPGEVRVEATGNTHVAVDTKVTVGAGETARGIKLIAARGAAVSVLVVDPSGDPVANADVEVHEVPVEQGSGSFSFRSRTVERSVGDDHDHTEVFDGGPRALGDGKTDADGRVTIAGLTAGEVMVHARHEELAPAVPARVALPASGTAEARLAMRQGGAVDLRVVDVDGNPVSAANIVVDGPSGAEDAEKRTAKTDGDGAAFVAQLPAGTYTAAIRAKPRPMSFGGASIMLAGGEGAVLESSRVQLTVQSGQTAQAQLVQPTLTTVKGTLRDATGAVPRGKVQLTQKGDVHSQMFASMGGGYTATTDDDGSFSIADVPPGKYTLSYGRKRQAVQAEEELELNGEREIERNLLITGGEIAVHVLGGDGEPLRKAEVKVERLGQPGAPRQRTAMIAMVAIDDGGGEQSMEFGTPQPSVFTDEEGIARIKDIPPGNYQLVIEHSRHITRELDDVEVVANGVKDVGTIELLLGGRVRGKVVGSDGKAPMIANVELVRIADDERDTTMAQRGVFQFKGVSPGSYQARARGIGPEQTEWGPFEPIEVVAGESARVTLRLE